MAGNNEALTYRVPQFLGPGGWILYKGFEFKLSEVTWGPLHKNNGRYISHHLGATSLLGRHVLIKDEVHEIAPLTMKSATGEYAWNNRYRNWISVHKPYPYSTKIFDVLKYTLEDERDFYTTMDTHIERAYHFLVTDNLFIETYQH